MFSDKHIKNLRISHQLQDLIVNLGQLLKIKMYVVEKILLRR